MSCAAVQAFLVVIGLILSGALAGAIDLGYSNYGAFFMFFGALGVWEQFRLRASVARDATLVLSRPSGSTRP